MHQKSGSHKLQLNQAIRQIFLGARVLEPEDAQLFRSEALTATTQRSVFLFCAVLLIQAGNLLLPLFLPDFALSPLQHIGAYWLLLLAVIQLVLLVFFLHKPTAVNFSLRNLLLKGGWLLLLAGSLWFCCADYTVGSLSNYLQIVLALGAIPLLPMLQSLPALTVYAVVNLLLASRAGMTAQQSLQMIPIAVIALMVSVTQYQTRINAFSERNQLRRSNRSLTLLSQTDQLTGLYNRRGMEARLRSIFETMRRHGDSMTLLMLDIDCFKSYNDKYLHLMGDQCLQKISACLRSTAMRSTDTTARFGGEEFVVAAQNLTPEESVAFAMKIRRAIRELAIPFGCEGFDVVTVSIGVAIRETGPVQNPDRLLRDLISEADCELYNAKNTGRDCVSFLGEIYR